MKGNSSLKDLREWSVCWECLNYLSLTESLKDLEGKFYPVCLHLSVVVLTLLQMIYGLTS